jgi:Asp-tRNA(Asn)/Glu-tRNA(Gln) amidotransferase A subunit family amidase
VLVTPVLATELPPLGCLPTHGSDLDALNGTGQPAISLPMHWTPAGLPVGVQFVGRLGHDASLLHLAARLEEARDWADRRPTMRETGT